MVQGESSPPLKGGAGAAGPCRSPARSIDHTSILNPNKAVLTVDVEGKILMVNDMTSLLLGEDLTRDGTTLFHLLNSPADADTLRHTLRRRAAPQEKKEEAEESGAAADRKCKVAAEEDILESEGIVVFSGNVVTVETDDLGEMMVSMWLKELPLEAGEEPRWIVVLEPITITVSKVTVTPSGRLLSADARFGAVFGSEAVLDNDNLFNYVSDFRDPHHKIQDCVDQPCTGRLKDGETFPLSLSCVSVKSEKVDTASLDQSINTVFHVKIKLFSNISGLMVVDGKGAVLQYNHNFTRLLFGYGSKELEGQDISKVLPEFHEVSCSNPFKKDFFRSDQGLKDPSSLREDTQGLDKDSTIPYIDDSLKENADSKTEAEVEDRDKLTEGERSSRVGSPNKAFIMSDSQFTLSSTNLTTSKMGSLKSSLNATSNPSLNQSSIPKGDSPTPDGSPNRIRGGGSPNHVMRDITNSMNAFNLSEQQDMSRFPLSQMITSTPAAKKLCEGSSIQEGSYFSVGKHKDGSCISVLYQIRRLSLNGKDQFCLWITWEPSDSSGEDSKPRLESSSSEAPANKSLGSAIAKVTSESPLSPPNLADEDITTSETTTTQKLTMTSLGAESDDEATSRSVTHTDGSSAADYSLSPSYADVKRRSFSENDLLRRGKDNRDGNASLYEEPEWILTSGDYGLKYNILRQIGKGAFGYVKMSYRDTDGLIVVTKFIKKSQVYKDSWTVDKTTGKKVCLEVDLLMKLDHPNIVKALEYFENDKYFQLVMEKWGSGMDLFEFIDRNPALDEPLTSYIFRQIVSPLVYLRGLNIIHRDIKDENIIINQYFHIKLIDFGSATHLDPKKKFSQFAGTIEYCSPEVLKGHKYSGPELEIWSLGITLYTLVFGENPFSVVEQVLKDPLTMPISYSDALFSVLDGMLKKNPRDRMKLGAVADHEWTNQKVDMEYYCFEDIVPCDSCELSPVKYIYDYGSGEESFSTTSSSFVYEDRHSQSATENSLNRSARSANAFDGAEAPKKGMRLGRSGTSSWQSHKTSLTIDSACLASPEGKATRRTDSSSSVSEGTDASVSEIGSRSPSSSSFSSRRSRHLRSTNRSSESLGSFASRSSSNLNHSSCSSYSSTSSSYSSSSDASGSDNSSSTSSSDSSCSTCSGRSSSTSSLASQETVSIESSSDDDTLANTFTNALAVETLKQNQKQDQV